MTSSVIEVFTIDGNPDALVRIRVDSVQPLEQAINNICKKGVVIGTKTLTTSTPEAVRAK